MTPVLSLTLLSLRLKYLKYQPSVFLQSFVIIFIITIIIIIIVIIIIIITRYRFSSFTKLSVTNNLVTN